MDKNIARNLSSSISNHGIRDMLLRARKLIPENNWMLPSKINKGMTRGAAFNILSFGIDDDDFLHKEISTISKFNMIREFGEYISAEIYSAPIKIKKDQIVPFHQDPRPLNIE